jgi:hypothetical protein
MLIKLHVIYESHKLIFLFFSQNNLKIKYKPVEHSVIIDVVKHHVLFQFQLIFVVMYLMYLLFHVIFLVTIQKENIYIKIRRKKEML